MNDLNKELWKLGVPAKTQHNEVAPAQPVSYTHLDVYKRQLTGETTRNTGGCCRMT